MRKIPSELIDVGQLRLGLFVELGVGWMSHPFPTGRFKISSIQQIEAIRGLGLKQVRYFPDKSDPVSLDEAGSVPPQSDLASEAADRVFDLDAAQHRRQQHAEQIGAQQRSLLLCERRFEEATHFYKQAADQVLTQPPLAKERCLGLINGFLDQMQGQGESSIRLLSQGAGDRISTHAVNVSIISLLLGKAMGLAHAALVDLGLAAFLHDIGKSQLPDRVRWFDEQFSTAEYKLYQDHVAQSVALVRQLGLPESVLLAIGQHHEMVDGSGFPLRAQGERMTLPAKILALANRYENLCNPAKPATARTPHEALSFIFAQRKHRFDGVVLSAFIRMLGVHPPGSIIQLIDDRYAIVVAANTARPLKPRVIVHDPAVPRHEALILDLEYAPGIGIRRGIKPESLPADSADYLAPRQRVCYFFERSNASQHEPVEA